jgi:hypothetical protein
MVMISTNSGVYRGGLGSGFGVSGAYFGPDAATVGPDFAGFRPATAGGDLVLPHAVGVHGLLLFAVPAVLLAGTALTGRAQLRLVTTMVAAVGLGLAALLVHAFRMLPLDALSPAALVLLAVCTLAYLAAAGLAVVAAARSSAWRYGHSTSATALR